MRSKELGNKKKRLLARSSLCLWHSGLWVYFFLLLLKSCQTQYIQTLGRERGLFLFLGGGRGKGEKSPSYGTAFASLPTLGGGRGVLLILVYGLFKTLSEIGGGRKKTFLVGRERRAGGGGDIGATFRNCCAFFFVQKIWRFEKLFTPPSLLEIPHNYLGFFPPLLGRIFFLLFFAEEHSH